MVDPKKVDGVEQQDRRQRCEVATLHPLAMGRGAEPVGACRAVMPTVLDARDFECPLRLIGDLPVEFIPHPRYGVTVTAAESGPYP